MRRHPISSSLTTRNWEKAISLAEQLLVGVYRALFVDRSRPERCACAAVVTPQMKCVAVRACPTCSWRTPAEASSQVSADHDDDVRCALQCAFIFPSVSLATAHRLTEKLPTVKCVEECCCFNKLGDSVHDRVQKKVAGPAISAFHRRTSSKVVHQCIYDRSENRIQVF